MRIATGVPGFDAMIEGGLLDDRLYVVSGPPGSGKTTFCAQFVTQGAIDGERSLFLTLHESEGELVADMGGFGFGFDDAVKAGHVKILNAFDDDTKRLLSSSSRGGGEFPASVENFANQLVAYTKSRSISRLVIDSTMLLEYYFSDDRNALVKFLSKLKRADVTTLLISEMTDPSAYTDGHYLAHGVIFMHNYLEAGGMQRGIQLIKMRGTKIDCDIKTVEFTQRGLTVDAKTTIGT